LYNRLQFGDLTRQLFWPAQRPTAPSVLDWRDPLGPAGTCSGRRRSVTLCRTASIERRWVSLLIGSGADAAGATMSGVFA
jgi:hypothetical protein